ncbi:MAG: 7-carboxy-7-deazaguanine synthase QueE [Candidatus Kapaibacterium sp.]
MDNFNFLNKTLNISEIFYSIQGEGTRTGMPCVFVRLAGCNLRCKWCDTIYAQDINSEQKMSFNEILEKIYSYDCDFIEFTGGEPLMQEQVVELMNFLAQKKFTVAIETNGTFSIKELSPNIIKIIDIKCPSSNMEKYNLWENFQHITKNDELKFVVASEEDFAWSEEIIARHKLVRKDA